MSKRRKSKLGLLIIVCVFAYFIYVIIGQQKELLVKQKKYTETKGKITQEEIVRNELNRKEKEINTKEYAAQVARDELGMVKPEEKVYYDINE